MNIDTIYKFQKMPDIKAKTRLDLHAYSYHYSRLDVTGRDKKIFIYLSGKPYVKTNSFKREPDMCISNRNGHISGLFFPDIENYPNIAYGDIRGTQDALIAELAGQNTQLGIIIFKGLKEHSLSLYQLYTDGELDEDLKAHYKLLKVLN